MTRLLTIVDVAKLTGFSQRYWQRRAADGDMPGAKYITTGTRRTYRIEADTFLQWWNQQLKDIPQCQKTCASAAASGGTGSPDTVSRTKGRWKPASPASLKSALADTRSRAALSPGYRYDRTSRTHLQCEMSQHHLSPVRAYARIPCRSRPGNHQPLCLVPSCASPGSPFKLPLLARYLP